MSQAPSTFKFIKYPLMLSPYYFDPINLSCFMLNTFIIKSLAVEIIAENYYIESATNLNSTIFTVKEESNIKLELKTYSNL